MYSPTQFFQQVNFNLIKLSFILHKILFVNLIIEDLLQSTFICFIKATQCP